MSLVSALVVHVEIPVADLDRASRFYEAVFGFALQRTSIDGYEQALLPAAEGGEGASGALVKGDVYVPGKAGPVVYFGTRDVGAALRRAEAAGGAILYPPKRIEGLGVVAEFEDSEGNRIGLFSADG
jgi:predicted enzyme related to lactoylglutathione lyase